MPSWGQLLAEKNTLPPDRQSAWIVGKMTETLQRLSSLRNGKNVLFYGSAFLQKPQAASAFLQINSEDINGFMAGLYNMDWEKGLTLVLHTPGGSTNATETIVEYLNEKFANAEIEVIVPVYAMSAGTMISLASNRIVMDKPSQLGPIDPQFVGAGGSTSARAVVDQFDKAKEEILADPRTVQLWAPILQSLGPALLEQARNALEYGETMVTRWLARRQFAGKTDPQNEAAKVAHYFNVSNNHKSHGRRIGRDEAIRQGVLIEKLEENQELQDVVLTAYHLATLIFECTPTVKHIQTSHGNSWNKSLKT
jgi:ATP-dependent protease ClpP protease subunit